MYSPENYMWGWVVYCSGAALILLVFGYLIRNLPIIHLRNVLWLIIAAVLLTPATAYVDDPHLAPAFFVSLYEGIFLADENTGYQRALAPILATLFVATAGYVLVVLGWRLFRRRVVAEKPLKTQSGKDAEEASIEVGQESDSEPEPDVQGAEIRAGRD